jgi:hypothetical protein
MQRYSWIQKTDMGRGLSGGDGVAGLWCAAYTHDFDASVPHYCDSLWWDTSFCVTIVWVVCNCPIASAWTA